MSSNNPEIKPTIPDSENKPLSTDSSSQAEYDKKTKLWIGVAAIAILLVLVWFSDEKLKPILVCIVFSLLVAIAAGVFLEGKIKASGKKIWGHEVTAEGIGIVVFVLVMSASLYIYFLPDYFRDKGENGGTTGSVSSSPSPSPSLPISPSPISFAVTSFPCRDDNHNFSWSECNAHVHKSSAYSSRLAISRIPVDLEKKLKDAGIGLGEKEWIMKLKSGELRRELAPRFLADVDGDCIPDFCRIIKTNPSEEYDKVHVYSLKCALIKKKVGSEDISIGKEIFFANEEGLGYPSWNDHWMEDVDGDGRADYCGYIDFDYERDTPKPFPTPTTNPIPQCLLSGDYNQPRQRVRVAQIKPNDNIHRIIEDDFKLSRVINRQR